MESFNTAFTIGGVPLAWSAILVALAVFTAFIVSAVLVRKRGAYKDLALDVCIVSIPCGLLGARLFSVLSSKIALSSFFSLSTPGLNLPGALVFITIGLLIYLRVRRLPVDESFDVLLPGAFFGLAIGRWADFFLCEGLGPVAGEGVPKFFPLVTFTAQYFEDGVSVAYAVFFLDFLVCLALGIAALLLSRKWKPGKTALFTMTAYVFLAFILEWLRDGSTRSVVFGGIRFNQIVLFVMLLALIGVTLYTDFRKPGEPADVPDEPASPETDEAENAQDTEGHA